MKVFKITMAVVVLVLGLFAWALPIGPVSGFFIGGMPSDVPETWRDTSSIHEIRLKVGGAILPRVVTASGPRC